MMNQRKKVRLAMIGFRADPRLLDKFETQCEKIGITKSEAIRTIFNQYIIMPPVQANNNILNNNAI